MSRRLARLAPRQGMWRGAFPFVMLLGIVAVLLAGYWLLKNSRPSVRRTEVVTVLSTHAGWRGRWRASYVHRVRFPSGAEGDLTFDTLYRPGAVVKVLYSRNQSWGLVTVLLHAPCTPDCEAGQAEPTELKSSDDQR
jgi:hypothetical protein